MSKEKGNKNTGEKWEKVSIINKDNSRVDDILDRA